MEVGARVWISDPKGDDAWLLAEIQSKSSETLTALSIPSNKPISRPRLVTPLQDGEMVSEIKYDGVELANHPLSDAEQANGKDNDMITLPHLHEPAILHAIGERFNQGKIYTWTGPVLIAVNPFQRLPLYTSEILESYRREGLLRSQGMSNASGGGLAPHIYAIADRSYRQMMAPTRKSQSILISGESGAGKTESTKIVMLYLTTLGTAALKKNEAASSSGGGGDTTGGGGDLSIMEKVLQSNPILEAFGNARTLRNDNSSRFGKFIELGFSRSGTLVGAKVQTYLLEKVRLGFHASGERNYHMFYQLLRGANDVQKQKYQFHDGDTHGLELANYYHYTGQGGAPSLREFTDEEGFQYTLKAMSSLGWSEDKIDTVLSLVAGLLHLGQMTFDAVENEAGQDIAKVADESILQNAATLLGVDLDKLKAALTERILITRGEQIKIDLEPAQAADSRDALTKTMYGALFLWVVSQVNESIIWKNDSEVRSSTGVLDIFGFECFAINSFEQLCINFTNEALQQQFNKFIFKMEQAEYESEEIRWDFISFPDNQDCLDTIQSKPHGLLAMLDDECRLGARGNDRNWADRLYKHYIPNKNQTESDNTRFSATLVDKGRSIFTVRHFAGPVKYTATTGFLEKNKDEIPETAKNLFHSSQSWLIRDIYAVQMKETEESVPQSGKAAKSKTVSQQFKMQLVQLMEKVESTEPHYIRCLKPNDAAKPNLLTRRRLTEQLRYGGVLEAVRVARMGFPVRLNHDLFFQEYRLLLPSVPDEKLPWSLSGGNAQALCIKLVDILLEEGKKSHAAGEKVPHEEGISRSEKIRRMQTQPIPMVFPKTDVQLGKSKVFMRKPAHDALEAHRVFHQTAAATILQAWLRGMQKRVKFLILCDATETAQRFYRGCKGRERWWILREAKAGALLTRTFRMLIVQREFLRAKDGTIQLQALYRGLSTRKELASIKIQTQYRKYTKRSLFCNLRSATIALQCRQRCKIAKKELGSLKGEQKDIGKLKQNNEKLKLEMASLKAMLSAQAQGSANRAESEKELKEKELEIEKLEKRIAKLEVELEKEKALAKKLESDLETERARSNDKKEQISILREQNQNLQSRAPPSPMRNQSAPLRHSRTKSSSQLLPPSSPRSTQDTNTLQTATSSTATSDLAPNPINQQVLADQKALVARLEGELEKERNARRDADGEVIKLRAEMNGVKLDDSDVEALLPIVKDSRSIEEMKEAIAFPNLGEKGDIGSPHAIAHSSFDSREENVSSIKSVSADENPEITGIEPPDILRTPTRATLPLKKPNGKEAKKVLDEMGDSFKKLVKSPSDYLPMIKRGFANLADVNGQSEKDVVSMGWKVEVTSRREREEALRDEVNQYEVKMNKFASTLEQGVEVTMWQLNNTSDSGVAVVDDFTLKGTQIQVKLQRRGQFLVQAALAFNISGNMMSQVLNRRKVAKSALDPLSLNELLEVKAGCEGYDQTKLPSTRKAKKGENRLASLFLTLKASPTPYASSRLYFLKFKSRSARNDLLLGLRGLLADLQIHEGVSISSIQSPNQSSESPSRRQPGGTPNRVEDRGITPISQDKNVQIPIHEVLKAIDEERKSYDRLLLVMLQGSSDLKDREEEVLSLRSQFDTALLESKEKDKIQANDSKLIMQLSKKLETLLMDNEELRDQNETLNHHIVSLAEANGPKKDLKWV